MKRATDNIPARREPSAVIHVQARCKFRDAQPHSCCHRSGLQNLECIFCSKMRGESLVVDSNA
jgi:hypothetical protein